MARSFTFAVRYVVVSVESPYRTANVNERAREFFRSLLDHGSITRQKYPDPLSLPSPSATQVACCVFGAAPLERTARDALTGDATPYCRYAGFVGNKFLLLETLTAINVAKSFRT